MFNEKYPNIKSSTLETLDNYVKHGWEPGDFCRAVLENNLIMAFGRADLENRSAMFEICSYVYNEIPAQCHGSPEIVKNWLSKFRKNHE